MTGKTRIPQPFDNPPSGRKGEAPELVGTQKAGPGIEDHEGLGPGLGLGPQVGRHGVRQLVQQHPGRVRLGKEEGLGLNEGLGPLPLHHITEGVQGAPANPMRGTDAGSSFRRIPMVSMTKGTVSCGSAIRSRSTSARLRTGLAITGPGLNSSSIPIPSTGVMMSLKRMAASSSNRRMGWRVTSAASSGVFVRVRKSTFFLTSRYSGR